MNETGATQNQEKNSIVGSKNSSQSKPKGEARELAPHEYWTPERRAAAIPIPTPKESKTRKESVTTEETKQGGALGHIPAGLAKNTSGRKRGAEAGVSDKGGSAISDPKVYPYSTCGKLFFTQGGNNYTGSASVVARNILLTAGHCIYDGGWSSNMIFYPSYPQTAVHFSYAFEAVWTAWAKDGNKAYDYGMVWIDNNPGDTLGWLGLLWNANTTGRVWEAVGYPSRPNPPFNGSSMDGTIGTVAASSTPGTIGLTNDNMEQGSSGGPWITDFNGSPREYANGLQSFHINDGDSVEYGPYFTSALKGLYDWISNPANRH